jgi:anti-anti-sigma factor
MKLVEAVAEDVMVVEAYGRLDSTTSKMFGDRLISLLQTGRGSLVVDLKNIAYISSAGFRALLIANRAADGTASSRSAASPARSGGCSTSAASPANF